MLPLSEVSEIRRRLKLIFGGGVPNVNYVTREIAAKVTFVMLYVDAVEGTGNFLRPDQVTRMSDEQSLKHDTESRSTWRIASMRSLKGDVPGRWYQTNTREPIRDETLRQGLVPLGAATERSDLPATSSAGKYALKREFAELFDPSLSDEQLNAKIESWQRLHLTPGARARVFLHKKTTVASEDALVARLPNGERRQLTSGPSSIIAKAVIEEFCTRFLEQPGLLWLSESSKKEDKRDLELAQGLGINIDSAKNLPDVILVDTGGEDTLFVFVEVVASDGPITESRREALLKLLEQGGYGPQNAAFLTAYADREAPAFKKTVPALAWNSFAWCVTEPDKIIGMHQLSSFGSLKRFLRDALL